MFRTTPRTLGVKHGPPSNHLEVVVERSTAGRVLSPRAWPVSNKSPSPKCLLITSVQKNFGLASENIASLQIAPNWFSLSWFERKCRGPFGNVTNEVEITKKYRKFNNRSFRGKRGQGLHELIPQLRTQKYILEADLISIFLVHVPKDNFTLEIRNHSRDRNVLVTCLLKVS